MSKSRQRRRVRIAVLRSLDWRLEELRDGSVRLETRRPSYKTQDGFVIKWVHFPWEKKATLN